MPRNQETCEITVGGSTYKNWNQVEVTITIGDPTREAGFVTTEIDSPSGGTRIMPSQPVTIKMAGQLVFTGYVHSRTASYDKGRHSVLILSKGYNDKIARGAVSDYKTGGQLKSTTWKQMADKVMKAQGLKPVTMVGNGKASQTKFKSAQHIPGERAFRYLDRYGRTAGVVLHEGPNGNMLAFTDPNMQRPGGELVEGYNILRATAKITDETSPGSRTTYGQNKADDKTNMRKANQIASNSKDDKGGGGGGGGGGGNQPGAGGGFGGGDTSGGGSIGRSEPKAGVPQPGDETGEDPVGGPSNPNPNPTVQPGDETGEDPVGGPSGRQLSSDVGVGALVVQPGDETGEDPVGGPSSATSGHSGGGAESSSLTSSAAKKPDELEASEIKHDDVNQSKSRTSFGDMWQKENYEIIAEIVVQGWQDSQGMVWDCATTAGYHYVQVDAPLLALTQQLLIKKVVLSQTNEEGSITTLTLGNRSGSGQDYASSSSSKPSTPNADGVLPDTAAGAGKPIGQGGIGHA